jgi:hypothetical protein
LDESSVAGQEQETRARSLNDVSHRFSFMGAEIVEDDDVAGFEGRNEELFDVGEKPFAVDGTVEQAGPSRRGARRAGEKP